MKNKLFQNRILTGLVFTALISFMSFAYAQGQAPAQSGSGQKQKEAAQAADEDAFTVDTVSGEVTVIGKDFISIVYDHDYDTGTEYEIMIPLEKSTALKHKKNLSEIKAGDLVSVEYEKPVEGSKRKVKARTINFIQSGISGLTTEATQ